MKVPSGGVKRTPVEVMYGCSVRVTLGLTTDDVARMSSRCLLSRYCASVIDTESGSGLTVTEVSSGADTAPVEFCAVMVRLITEGRI